MICRRQHRPIPSPATPPPIGQRTQLAYILDQYQFSGLSLWDGNSNQDITGSGSIPLLSDIAISRGTPNSGYSQQFPYANIGNATYTPPDTNNTNKLYNPTHSATITGNPIRKPSTGRVGPPYNNVDTITQNLTSLKGIIWNNWLGSTPTSTSQSTKFQKQLQDNYGSGFEIEAYVFPFNYPLPSGTDSIWYKNEEVCLEKYQFSLPYTNSGGSTPNTRDILSINFSTDTRSVIDWFNSTNQDQIARFITCLVSGSINATKNKSGNYTFSEGSQGWVFRTLPTITGNTVTAQLPVTLLTGVMLPNVNLQSAGSNTASEFAEYVNRGYDTSTVQVYDIGTAKIIITKLSDTDYSITSTLIDYNPNPSPVSKPQDCPTNPPLVPCLITPTPTPASLPTLPPTATAGKNILCRYLNEGIFIRGNDGQYATTLDTVANFLDETAPFSLQNGIPSLSSNPYQQLLPNLGPAYSATALNVNIEYPLIWYVPDYVDPFVIC
jgi:hypothetical protein